MSKIKTKKMNLLDIMFKYEDEIKQLQPTLMEIDSFISTLYETHGIVTYSDYKNGKGYFISFHDNHNNKKHYHIDVGYVDFDSKFNNVTHLMLDRYYTPLFISFIKENRK